MTELVDGLIRHADDVEVHDRAAARAVDDVDDASQERFVGVAGDDQGAGTDAVRLGSGVEERPLLTMVILERPVPRTRSYAPS